MSEAEILVEFSLFVTHLVSVCGRRDRGEKGEREGVRERERERERVSGGGGMIEK